MAAEQDLQQTFKIYIGQNDILNLEVNSGVNDVASNIKQAELIKQAIERILAEQKPKKFHCLVDISGLGEKAHYPSPQARQIYASLLDLEQLNKIAVVAPNTLLQSVMRFIIYFSGKQKVVNFFNTRLEAQNWLKEKEQE
jgi:hypothetical protein